MNTHTVEGVGNKAFIDGDNKQEEAEQEEEEEDVCTV